MKDNFQIVSYKPSLKKYFILLNEEWLEKYFYVEKYDKELLENCENEIIKKGGQIYFGLLGLYLFILVCVCEIIVCI